MSLTRTKFSDVLFDCGRPNCDRSSFKSLWYSRAWSSFIESDRWSVRNVIYIRFSAQLRFINIRQNQKPSLTRNNRLFMPDGYKLIWPINWKLNWSGRLFAAADVFLLLLLSDPPPWLYECTDGGKQQCFCNRSEEFFCVCYLVITLTWKIQRNAGENVKIIIF